MKLSLLTYNIAREWNLNKIIEMCKKLGFAGIEFRAEQGHKHGVELDASKELIKEIKEKIEDAYLDVAGIATSCRFEYTDQNTRRLNIERTKRFVELAADLDCNNVRVFGNTFQPGADKMETIKWVGEALNELNEFAKHYRVNVLLEMHGDFNYWKYAIKAIEYSKCSNSGLVYNCSVKDMVGSSIKDTYSRVSQYIKHVHMHSFLKNYPYKELLQLLKDDGYKGYLSAEIDEPSSDGETVLAYYTKLYYEMLSSLK